MTEILKRCPFCGNEAEFNSDEFGEGVCCKSCGAAMRNGVYGECGRKLASADWNARPIENELEAEIALLQRKLNESIEDNYKNAWKIQQQAERGAKIAQKENKRLREALEVILDAAQKDEPCILAIKTVAYTTLKGERK